MQHIGQERLVMEVQIGESVEGYERIRKVSEKEVEGLAKEKFPKGAYVYAVLDDAVGFGCYENGQFSIGLRNQKTPEPLRWEYLRELRIFDESGELLLGPFEGHWTGRYRGSMVKQDDDRKEYYIDEEQKLWGKKKEGDQVCKLGWSLLTSDRGTQIQIPMLLSGNNETEAALKIRRYIRIPNKENQELVYQTDLRMLGFCLWKLEVE